MRNSILQNEPEPKKDRWLIDLSQVITRIDHLLQRLAIDPTLFDATYGEQLRAQKQFALRVPMPFVARMEKGNINDPLLKQVLPLADELLSTPGFITDPLQEQNNKQPMILHKYKNRALLMLKTGCAINCRYCFRRHFPYAQNHNTHDQLQAALNYVAEHTELDEMILSGGDPLMAKDKEIESILWQLDAFPHLKRLRIHTRLAVVLPHRITSRLCQLFAQSRLKIVLVTHINHPNEIDQSVISAMQQLTQANVTLLNQSVLLKGINDEAKLLKQLSIKLFDEAGILPYYLHLLDKVAGAAHFYVDDERAKEIMRQLACDVSGFLLPILAREIGGESHKRRVDYMS